MMRLFYSVDVHGAETVWRKWITAITMYDCNGLILSGDLAGKALVPLIRQDDGAYKSGYFGQTVTLRTEEEMADWERKLGNGGVYSCRIDKAKLEQMKNDEKLVDEEMKKAVVARLYHWLELLTEKIDTQKIFTVCMPGNDDPLELDQAIKSFADKGVHYPVDKVLEIEGHEMISCEYVTPTPWDTPREKSEKDLEKLLEEKVAMLKNPRTAIFNFHCPPIDTDIDLAPKLSKNLKIEAGAEGVKMVHVGSHAVRKVIEKHQPMLGLHGHIHESSGFSTIGETLCLNPGSEYGEGLLRGYIIEIEKEGLTKYWKVQG